MAVVGVTLTPVTVPFDPPGGLHAVIRAVRRKAEAVIWRAGRLESRLIRGEKSFVGGAGKGATGRISVCKPVAGRLGEASGPIAKQSLHLHAPHVHEG